METRKPGVGVGVMLINKKGDVLLGRRHHDPAKADSALHGEGTWTFPGGKLDFGESVFSGAARELMEETGMAAKGLELFSVGNEIRHDVHFITLGFLSRDFTGEPKVREPDEITEWRWFPLNQLPEPMFPPARKMVENYKSQRLIADSE